MPDKLFRFQVMNSDAADMAMPENHYRKMINCRPDNMAAKSGGVVKTIAGTKIMNRFLVGGHIYEAGDVVTEDGTEIEPTTLTGFLLEVFNETLEYIGGCQDGKRASIIGFFRGTTAVYVCEYNTTSKVNTLILGTTMNMPSRITHCGVIDDYLLWISGGNAMKINLAEAMMDTTTDRYSQRMISLDKYPPLMPPSVIQFNDEDMAVNNINDITFQFAYCWKYDNSELSSWSPFSVSVVPVAINDLDTVFLYNAIDVTVNTGGSDVSEIWIAARMGDGKEFVISDKIKKGSTLSDNTSYTYRFYNNKYSSSVSQDDVFTNTFNPYHEVECLAITRDNFAVLGNLRDGLPAPTNTTLNISLLWGANGDTRVHAFKMGAIHEFGLVFRDGNGRTNGVVATKEISIPFPTEDGYPGVTTYHYAHLSWNVTGDAPDWAESMSIVYLGNKTLSSFVQYMLKDAYDMGDYTYLDISFLNKYKGGTSALDPGRPSSILGRYTFSKGDRIRFISDKNGNLLSTPLDIQVLDYVTERTDSGGNVLYENTIYVNKFDFAAKNIGKKSLFEIYTPKREFVDNLYFEIGKVFPVANGVIQTTSGILDGGDVYSRVRDFVTYDLANLVSDKSGDEYHYGDTGITPALNVLVTAEDVHPVPWLDGSAAGSVTAGFYHNQRDTERIIHVFGEFDIRVCYDKGVTFKFRQFDASGTLIKDKTMQGTLTITGTDDLTNDHTGFTASITGLIDETVTVPVGGYLVFYLDQPGNSRLRVDAPTTIDFSVQIFDPEYMGDNSKCIEDRSYSDFYESNEHNLGRPYVEVDEDLGIRNDIVYTGKYFSDTEINDLNRVKTDLIKHVPYEYGYITALKVYGDTLKALTSDKEISFYMGKEQYMDGSGERKLVMSSSSIGTMREYESDYGTVNPESILINGRSMYYYDRKNASVVRSSVDGQKDIFSLGQQSFMREITDRINNAVSYAVFIGNNDKNNEIIISFIVGGDSETIVFSEEGKFTHHLSLKDALATPIEGMMHYGENLLFYHNGSANLNEAGAVASFFGNTKVCSIEFILNQDPVSSKVLNSIYMQSTGTWAVTISTPPRSPYVYGMETRILPERFRLQEGMITSDIPFNLKGPDGVSRTIGYANGDVMRGTTATVLMTTTPSTEKQLDFVGIKYEQSPY